MPDPDRPGRRFKVALAPRDESDDSSILDIVRKAIEDGLLTPAGGTMPSVSEERKSLAERHAVDEKLEVAAREAVEEVLAKMIEEFQAAGKEPAFDPAAWAAQLSKVWDVVRKAKATGVALRVMSDEPPPASGS